MNPEMTQAIANAITPRLQELILFPTEKCNFRCTYCYEDFELGRMSETTIVALERFMTKRATQGLKVLRLSWFGGEPLVARDIVLRLSRHAHDLATKHKFALEGGMTTNAYLLNKSLAMDLIACKQDFFQITLDGWGAGHDATRQMANGTGTFDVIWANLLALRSLPDTFDCMLRVHVTDKNHQSLVMLCANIREHFGHDSRFRVDFQHVRDMGGEAGGKVVDIYGSGVFEQVTEGLRRVLRGEQMSQGVEEPDSALGRPLLAEQSGMKAPRGESAGSVRASQLLGINDLYVCYASRPNSLLVRSNGRIGKCTVALYSPANDVGYLEHDGSVVISDALLQPWLRGIGSQDLNELACPLDHLPPAMSALPAPQPVRFMKKESIYA